MDHLLGKTALVTGGSRNIGKAIALALGEAGASVAITDVLFENTENDVQVSSSYKPHASHFWQTGEIETKTTINEIHAMESKSCYMKMDVTNLEEVRKVIKAVEIELGPVDILVNNAAVMENLGKFDDLKPEQWEHYLNVNLTGAFNCISTVWASMVRKKWGRIINISSVAGLMGAWLNPAYGATKAGIVGLTKSLAIEAGRHAITVNAVCPGFIATEVLKLYDLSLIERIEKRTALRRLGRPEEVAQSVVFLASEAASYITGAVIPVTGGIDLLMF